MTVSIEQRREKDKESQGKKDRAQIMLALQIALCGAPVAIVEKKK